MAAFGSLKYRQIYHCKCLIKHSHNQQLFAVFLHITKYFMHFFFGYKPVLEKFTKPNNIFYCNLSLKKFSFSAFNLVGHFRWFEIWFYRYLLNAIRDNKPLVSKCTVIIWYSIKLGWKWFENNHVVNTLYSISNNLSSVTLVNNKLMKFLYLSFSLSLSHAFNQFPIHNHKNTINRHHTQIPCETNKKNYNKCIIVIS